MLPNQFNSGFVGQQGMQPGMLPQQHPSNQVDTTQSVPGLPNPEHGRMWQQLQHNQRLAQFRQPMGGEMGGGHANQQVSIGPLLFPRFPLSTSHCLALCLYPFPHTFTRRISLSMRSVFFPFLCIQSPQHIISGLFLPYGIVATYCLCHRAGRMSG